MDGHDKAIVTVVIVVALGIVGLIGTTGYFMDKSDQRVKELQAKCIEAKGDMIMDSRYGTYQGCRTR